MKYISFAAQKQEGLKKPECALKKMPTRIFDNVIRLMTGGESALDEAIIDTLIRIAIDLEVEGGLDSKREILAKLMQVKQAIYGDKRRTRVDARVATIGVFTVEDVRQAYVELEEMEEEDKDEVV